MMEMSIKMIEEMDKEKTKNTATDTINATNEVIEKSAAEAADVKATTMMIGKNQASPEGNERGAASSSGV